METKQNRCAGTDFYATPLGRSVLGYAEEVLRNATYRTVLEGKVDLVFTSPPFPLNRKKRYGNEQGEAYISWLAAFAPLFKRILRSEGSIVLELGNAWEPGRPAMSILALKALLGFLGGADRLPSASSSSGTIQRNCPRRHNGSTSNASV